MSVQREEQALRIMEALSGVEEELLERCEKRETHVAKRRQLLRSAVRYGGLCAACLCLLLVGSVYLRVSQPKNESCADAANGDFEGAAAENFDVTNEGAMRAEAEEQEMPAVEEAEKEVQENSCVSGGTQETDGMTSGDIAEGCLADSRQVLDLQEAREIPRFAAYIPDSMPAGYVFEEARGAVSEEGQYESISLSWSRGMDSILWSVTPVEPSEAACVEVEELDKYDVHRYEIPYADSVPEEYREVFQDPVFRAEDLSLEVVERRMKSVQDAGDTDTPRGMFSVLYEDGILIRFNGRGTAAEIWELFQALQK